MRDLATAVQDVEHLVEMQPEELASTLIFLLKKRIDGGQQRMVILGNCLNELGTRDNQGKVPFEDQWRGKVEVAVIEAWAWLEAQGLLVPVPGTNGQNGWRRLSRRAERFQDERDFSQYLATRYLRKELLHPKIAASVWSAFLRGEFDVAVFQAMKAVETSVREAAGYSESDYGLDMVRRAFHPEKGPLTSSTAPKAEREALMALFAGAIGSYKNPHSHRDVELSDPVEAMEVVMLANHLLRIVDTRTADEGSET